MSRRIYRLTVTLVGTDPAVWRQVLVPGGYTLDRVSRVIRLAFGWYGHHLHCFEIRARQYGVPDPLAEHEDEIDVRLDAVAKEGDRFSYVYDFDDWWEHEVVVEAVLPARPDGRYPACVDADGAPPPEDIGGLTAFSQMLELIADPALPDRGGLRDWIALYHSVDVDAARISTLLRRMT
jgi:hypothetical protein